VAHHHLDGPEGKKEEKRSERGEPRTYPADEDGCEGTSAHGKKRRV
jgi:hypothetical protein